MSRVHPEDRRFAIPPQTIDDAIRDAKDTNRNIALFYRMESCVGCQHAAAFSFDSAGKPSRLLGISIDITARKQAELDAQRDRAELVSSQSCGVDG